MADRPATTRLRRRLGLASRVAVAAAALAGAACGAPTDGPLPPDFASRLGVGFGCGDLFFYAVDPTDSYLLVVAAPGRVAEAQDAGVATTTTFDLPAPGIEVAVRVGARVSDAACDDVIENGGPRVDRTYRAVAGTATITVRPGDTALTARGDLDLEGVVLEPDDGGESVTIDALRMTDIHVGWLAG
jgi:hypothetical protein